MLRRRPVFTLALSLAAALAVVAAVLWLIPSDYYLVRPARAQAVDPLVSVPGESMKERTAGIYMVAVRVSRASLFERFFPEIYAHADLVPEHVLNPAGVTDTERRQQGFQQMSHSQKVAVVVALRELGYTVPGGAVISRLAGNAPARGTLRPRDVVIEADGEIVDSPDDLIRIMRRVRPGETVDLVVRRGNRKLRLQAETKADPEERGRALLGVFLGEPDRFRFPVDVRITTPGIGGPSAGLAFALDILDERGRDLDHGRTVVATGELSLGGRVLPIGEIQQKTIGAREAGADVFLVPDKNAAEARKHAQGLRIVAVSTFHEALTALTTGQVVQLETAGRNLAEIACFSWGQRLTGQGSRPRMGPSRPMAKRRKVTCGDCYFRQAGLCALCDGPCPTFRRAEARLSPPAQPKLIARPSARAAHAAA